MQRFALKLVLLVMFVFSIVGTGGGGGGGGDDGGGTAGAGGSAGTGGTGGSGGAPATTVRMGYIDNTSTFQDQQVGIGTPVLSPKGSSDITINFVDQNGVLSSLPAVVSFSSPCINTGKATMTPASASTSTGHVIATYTDISCGGTGASNVADLITATGSTNGQNLTATGTINVQPSIVGSIQFVSADPTIIGIAGSGSGLPEQSQVNFKLLSASGSGVPGATIDLSLNNTAGGITFANGMTTATATTQAGGEFSVVVKSGTIATAVRVKATYAGPPAISTQSSNLTITTGIADQDSFSLSATRFNVRGLNFNGTTVPIRVDAADQNNNPVPDGTAVNFRTEGGSIVGSCFTSNGVCTVDWKSQDPRPADGRSTILAYAEGQESFNDANGSGTFDDAEFDVDNDLPEAWHDTNEDDMRQNTEFFVDFNLDGSYTAKDNKYNGLLCTTPGTGLCSTQKTITARKQLVIIMSGDTATFGSGDVYIGDDGSNSNPGTDADDAGVINFQGNGEITTVTVVVRDINNQPMAQGTTVTGSTTIGNMGGVAAFTVPNTSIGFDPVHPVTLGDVTPPLDPDQIIEGVNLFRFTVLGPDCATMPAPGIFQVVVQTPGAGATPPLQVTARCSP